MAGHLVEVNESNFENEVVKASTPVLVDFWATWCGPCKALTPTLETIATERAGRVKIVKVDVDGSPNLAAKFGIRSVPTLLLFRNGERVDQLIGNVPKGQIEDVLKKVL